VIDGVCAKAKPAANQSVTPTHRFLIVIPKPTPHPTQPHNLRTKISTAEHLLIAPNYS